MKVRSPRVFFFYQNIIFDRQDRRDKEKLVNNLNNSKVAIEKKHNIDYYYQKVIYRNMSVIKNFWKKFF